MAIAEEIGASGLVAAVVAGLITGQGAARHLSPSQRMSDSQIWETDPIHHSGTILEIDVGLELHTLVEDLHDGSLASILSASGIALIMLVASVLIRTAFVYPLLHLLRKRRASGVKAFAPHLEAAQIRLEGGDPAEAGIEPAALELT